MTAIANVDVPGSDNPRLEALEPFDRRELPVSRRRALSEADRLRYEHSLAEILSALGLDLETPGTRDTPRRFLAALVDATEGYEGDPKLVTAFPTECHGGANCELAQIVEGPIQFSAL